MTAPHRIEVESYRLLRRDVVCSHLPPLTRAVVERMVHATAEVAWVDDVVADETALAAGRAALLDGAPIVADVRMVAAGITGIDVRIGLAEPAADAPPPGLTRTAAGLLAALRRSPPGAVVVIGCAPTALDALLDAGATLPRPALVIGVPVGYVGAVEAKQRLRDSDLPAISNRGRRGGAAAAAAVVNALRFHPRHLPDSRHQEHLP